MSPGAAISLATAVLLLCSACAGSLGLVRAPPLPVEARGDMQQFLVVTVRNDARAGVSGAGSTPRGYSAVARYGVTASAARAVAGIERDYDLRAVSAWPISTLRVHCVMFRLPDLASRSMIMARLAHDPRVDEVQPLNRFDTESSALASSGHQAWMPYNDPYAPLQHSLRELDVIAAQRHSRGAGVEIAVVDTGVDVHHPDFTGRIIGLRDFVNVAEDTSASDVHGTEVAGVIAAVADNGIGMVGVAPQSRLLVLKACWPISPGSASARCNSFTLAQALEAAILAHVDIVNLSLSGPPDPLLTRLIQEGSRAGIIFVAAVPPEPADAAPAADAFPARLEPVISVAASEAPSSDPRDLPAPGSDILTLMPGGHYDFASGSSLATAEVTGIVALLVSEQPHLSAMQVRALLAQSVSPIRMSAGPFESIDACVALALLQRRPRSTCDSPREAR